MTEIPVEVSQLTEEGEVVWKHQIFEFDTAKDFMIRDTDLQGESCRIALLIQRYGELWAALKAQNLRKEDHVKLVYAQVAHAIRVHAEVDGVKVTEVRIKEEVTIHADYQAAVQDAANTQSLALVSEAWWTSVRHKSEHIRSMTFMQNTELKNI